MANSHHVTELLKSLKSKYQVILDDAVEFYQAYDQVYGVFAKQSNKLKEIEKQLSTIHSYKEKHGVFPQIKGQDDPEAYIAELKQMRSRAEREFNRVEPEVLKGFEKRRAFLAEISSKIAKATLTDRDASQFIATMLLRSPLPNDHSRCATNEKNKPVYIAALMICLIRKLIDAQLLNNDFIAERLPTIVHDEHNPDLFTYEEESLERYIDHVLTPVITAALIHHIGSYSKEANVLYDGNRFRMLDEDNRKVLIRHIYDHSVNYLHYGIGAPKRHEYSSDQEFNEAKQSFALTEEILKNYTNSSHPVGNLLRIPMIYSSFMLSTKPKHDFRISYKAYDILQSGITKGVVYSKYAGAFLDMVGQYPLGAGVVFISKETGYPERAVVSRLNPSQPTSAIVKQLTRRQVHFDDHTQVEVSEGYLINNEEAREKSDFGPSYYKKQYPEGFFWCPIEPWERDIDHNKFWRRDNKVKRN